MSATSISMRLWRRTSHLFMVIFGSNAHAWLHGIIHQYTTGGWKQLRRYGHTKTNNCKILAVCAIMKNESSYLQEWIEFHRAVGVQKFYLYANNCTDNPEKVLMPYIQSGIVEYEVMNGDLKQVPAYQDCLDKHHADVEWLAFIDLDEFIVPGEGKSIVEILQKQCKEFNQVLLRWLFFGSNGHTKRMPGGVIERFTRRGEYSGEAWQTKAIVRPRKVYEVHVHQHFVSGRTKLMTEDILRINHYYCKSWEEYTARANRGDVFLGQTKHCRELFEKRDLNCIEDLSALRLLPKANN